MNRNHILALTLVCLAFFSTLLKKEFFSSDKNVPAVGNPTSDGTVVPLAKNIGPPSFGVDQQRGNSSALSATGTYSLQGQGSPMLDPNQPNSRQISSNRPSFRQQDNGDSLKQTVDGLRGGDASDGRVAQRNIYFDALAEQMKEMKKSNPNAVEDDSVEEETEESADSEDADNSEDNSEEIYGEEDNENDSENNDETEDDAALVEPIDNETAEQEEPEFENNGDATTNSVPMT